MNRSLPSRRVAIIVALAIVTAGGCLHRGGPEPTPPAPRPAVQQMIAPVEGPPAAALISGTEVESPEPYIESLIAVDSDVRLVLQKIAEIGKRDLIISGGIRKKISVEYYHVPVSVALKDLLARTGLRLGMGTSAPLPFDTVTVFYRLPTNVDSLSTEDIMRRFGVSRELADLIVKSRKP